MDDVRYPAQFFDGFQYTSHKEDAAFIIVNVLLPVLARHNVSAVEEVFIVDEVNLHTGGLDGSHLNNKRMVGVVHNEVHAGEPDHFVQLVAPLVDDSILGHKRPDFPAVFQNGLWKATAKS
ncbi:hypothetical protein Barb6XT_01346 [Bacteroidales bacterium Barb6XT]|nr:hypothetical protein Barb6XT_01346 [Bacteroidales bacterium Barb6XT]